MTEFDAEAVAKIIKPPEDHIMGIMLMISKADRPAYPLSDHHPIRCADS